MILSLINDGNPHVWNLITTPPWLETTRLSASLVKTTLLMSNIPPSFPGSAHDSSRGGSRGQEAECRPEPPNQAVLWRECIQVILSALSLFSCHYWHSVLQTLMCRHIPGWLSSSTTWSTSRCCPARWATGGRPSGWGGRRTKSGSTGQHRHWIKLTGHPGNP